MSFFVLFSRFQAHASCGVDSSQLLAWLSRSWLLGTSTNFYLHQISISYQKVGAQWGQVFLCATACSLSVVVVPLKVKRWEMKVKGLICGNFVLDRKLYQPVCEAHPEPLQDPAEQALAMHKNKLLNGTISKKGVHALVANNLTLTWNSGIALSGGCCSPC